MRPESRMQAACLAIQPGNNHEEKSISQSNYLLQIKYFKLEEVKMKFYI